MTVYKSPWINPRRNGQLGMVPFLSDTVKGSATQVTPNGIATDGDPMEKDPTGFGIAEYVPPIPWRGNRSGE